MGRSSRRKQQRRDDPVWQGLKAEARGRRMPALLETYERALATRGIEGMKEGLYSRNNQRWANIQQHGPQLAAQVMPVLGPSGVIQLLAEKIGANRGRLPASPYGSPIDHLAWGIDGVTSACRMLLLGQAFGAAVLARTQLERWTFNLAHGLGVEFAFGDLGKANMCTLWDVHHLHVDIAETWNELSELLHGRGKYLTVGHWEAVDIMHGDVPSALADLAKSLGPILAQLRSVALGQAAEKQMATATHLLRGWPESTAYEAPVDFPSSAMSTAGLWPLLHNHVSEDLTLVALVAPPSARLCASRDRFIDEGKALFSPAELPGLVLADHRYRAWHEAARGFGAEAVEVGPLFNPGVIALRAQQLILTAEAAALTSSWSHPQPGSDSLWIAGSAIRSAFFLWLEDDDRALACVRAALEAVARARAWRTRPDRASAMRSNAISRDWFELAGWRRLKLLNRSLGELSHSMPASKWIGARAALIAAIPSHEHGQPGAVARGAAVRSAIGLLGVETIEWLRLQSASLADALSEILVSDQGMVYVNEEQWLDQVWSAREVDFGEPDFSFVSRDADSEHDVD
jgi:hypothetical protein